ncbi:hypothetical protein SCALM49S_08778 [Streptomyces californicus]
MAMARVSCASWEMEPDDMAPVENRLTISETGSTSSSGIGCRSDLKPNRPRSVISRSDCSLTRSVYFLKISYLPERVECWRRKTVSGSNRCGSPSRRHWYSPPISSARCAGAMPLAGYASACRAATSWAMTSMPTPPILVAVPLKYLATKCSSRPTASKTWAPR